MSNTVINGLDYGPLAFLVGQWQGEQGVDVSPEGDGSTEQSSFYEQLVFEPAGDVTNAEQQTLVALRYHQKVYRSSNQQQFHDQIGYWIWDSAEQQLMYTLTIPRGVALVAGGAFDMATIKSDERAATLSVAAADGSDWSVAQSPFMRSKAKTTGYNLELSVDGDSLKYAQTIMLDIYGKAFTHTDNSQLQRC